MRSHYKKMADRSCVYLCLNHNLGYSLGTIQLSHLLIHVKETVLQPHLNIVMTG